MTSQCPIPLVTIVTPTIDSSHYIDEAVMSAQSQEHPLLEHIVVHDGGNLFIDRLGGKFPTLRFVKGEGQGATAAVALGIRQAKGSFILLLNSDDRMMPGSISALAEASEVRPDIEIWSGGTRIFMRGPEGHEITVRCLDDRESTKLAMANVLDDLPLMTARFIHRDVFVRLGPLNTEYSACSDREYMLRLVLADVTEASLGIRVSEMRLHDGSATIRMPGKWVPRYLAEHVEIARHHMSAEADQRYRSALRDWHARETLRKAFYELRAGELKNLRTTVTSSFGYDLAWPWHARSAAAAVRLRRRGITNPDRQ